MVLLSLLSATLVTPDSTHRKVTDGVGNCIFSAEGLPFGKEEVYKPETSFSTSHPILEWRCYFPKQVKEYREVGAFYNQLRDEGQYTTYLSIEVPDGGRTFFEAMGTITPDSDSYEWDQQRTIASGKGCYKRDGECIDLDKQVRALAKEEKAALPYTAEVCFSHSFKWTDAYEEAWDDFSQTWKKTRTKVESQKMAVGCVSWTAE